MGHEDTSYRPVRLFFRQVSHVSEDLTDGSTVALCQPLVRPLPERCQNYPRTCCQSVQNARERSAPSDQRYGKIAPIAGDFEGRSRSLHISLQREFTEQGGSKPASSSAAFRSGRNQGSELVARCQIGSQPVRNLLYRTDRISCMD